MNNILSFKKSITLIAILALISCFSCIKNQNNKYQFIDKNDLAKDILVLSDDSLQGREPLSDGEVKTVKYLESRMKDIGLEPAFNGSYLQKVPFVKLTSLVPDVVKVNTPKGAVEWKSIEEYSAWSPVLEEKINIQNVEIVFVGFGVNAPEVGWNDFKGIDVKGKIILVIVNDPDFYTKDSTYFKGNTMTYYGRWRYKYEEAERQGALGCIIVHEDSGAGYPWSIVSVKTNTPDFYLDDAELLSKKCKLNGWINQDKAIELFNLCGLDFFDQRVEASKQSFKPFSLKSRISIEVKNSWSKAESNNIAGYIKGKTSPDEVIVYCAHWDHLGVGLPLDGDSIYNGASDNAAAIAWMLSIAKEFKNQTEQPERSILFFTPTGEESGLIGSEYYVKHSPFDVSKTIACINNDVILFLGKFKDVTVTGLGHSTLDELLKEVATAHNRYVVADPNPENGMFFRSDQLPFLKAGVPAMFAKGYSEQIELGREKTQQKIIEYWNTIYHKPSDEFIPERDNLDGLVEDVKLFFDFGSRLANERIYPMWYKNSEFYTDKINLNQ